MRKATRRRSFPQAMAPRVSFGPAGAGGKRVFMGVFAAREDAAGAVRRTVAWTGGQIAQSGALGEMQKVVEWQGLRRGERIFILSASGNGGKQTRGWFDPMKPH